MIKHFLRTVVLTVFIVSIACSEGDQGRRLSYAGIALDIGIQKMVSNYPSSSHLLVNDSDGRIQSLTADTLAFTSRLDSLNGVYRIRIAPGELREGISYLEFKVRNGIAYEIRMSFEGSQGAAIEGAFRPGQDGNSLYPRCDSVLGVLITEFGLPDSTSQWIEESCSHDESIWLSKSSLLKLDCCNFDESYRTEALALLLVRID